LCRDRDAKGAGGGTLAGGGVGQYLEAA